MNKPQEIILDFTSLLDVIMIILFWFIINYRAESIKIRDEANQQLEQAQSISAQAEEDMAGLERDRAAFEEEKQRWTEEAQLEVKRISATSERAAKSLEAMLEFSMSRNIKIYLITGSDTWFIDIYSDNKLIGTVRKGADIRAGLAQALENAGYSTEDTILCEFVFDIHAAGSYSANTDVTEALDLISHEYPFLYYSRTDVYLINN